MILGGNKISKLDRNKNKTIIGKSKYYFYIHLNLKKNKKINLPKNSNFTIFILDCENKHKIKLDNRIIEVRKNIFV